MQKTNILIGVPVGAVGIMMLVSPETFIKIAVIGIGIASLVNGVYILIAERNLIENNAFKLTLTVRAVVGFAVGVCAVLLPLLLAGIVWTVMLYTIAVYLTLSAASELYSTYKLREAGVDAKLFTVEMIASAVIALLLFCLPAKIGTALIRIGGAALLITAGVCFYTEWKKKPLIIQAEILPDNDQN